jgi:uncharacterized protein (DUF1499 family)
MIVAFFWIVLLSSSHAYLVPAIGRELRQRVAVSLLTTTLIISPQISQAEVPQGAQRLNGLQKGRLLQCRTLSNCISTSSVNSLDKYGKPLQYSGSSDEAWAKLKKVLAETQYLNIVEVDEEKKYIRSEGKSAVPPTSTDDVEFLIVQPDTDKLVTYRSNSREVITAGPQTVIGDGGSNRNRLDKIIRNLGWGFMGASKEDDAYIKEMESISFFKKMQRASQPNAINFEDNKPVE